MKHSWLSRWCLACGVLLAPAAAPAGPIDVSHPPAGRFVDDWAEIYLAGQKIGYAHSAIARRDDRIDTATTMVMELGRVNQPVKISIAQETTETVEGGPLAFRSTMDMATMKMSTEGTIKDGRVTLTAEQFGLKQVQTYDFPGGAIMTWGLYREGILRGFTPGTEYVLKLYAPELRQDGAVVSTTKIGEVEGFEHRGKRLAGRRVTATMETPMGSFETVSWVDEEGRPLKSRIPAPGIGDLELILTDQHTALGDFIPPELFMNTVVKAGREIDAQRAQRIRYRLAAKDPAVSLGEIPTSGMQAVTTRTPQAVEIVVTRQRHQAGAEPAEATTPHRSDHLGPNLMINTEDPKLIELAKQAGGGETEPFALGDRLRRFVTDYVTTKSLNIGFATAGEVCRTREGDCSEHGVLLAALGRLNGLPSRVVVGLAYVPRLGEQKGVFGYHMWTQFFIDGRWIDFDAALRESVCSPTRIAFATSSLKNAGLADLSLPLLSKIGAIDIEILEVESTPAPGD